MRVHQKPVVWAAGWCGLLARVCSWLAVAVVLVGLLALGTREAAAQVTPLEDVVPIADLEIQTDDLIRVATGYADAVREMKTAELSVRTLQVLRPGANVTNLEMQIAEINLQTAQQKVAILRAIAENLLETAKAKCAFLKRMEGDGQQDAAASESNPRLARAEAAVRILKMILEIR